MECALNIFDIDASYQAFIEYWDRLVAYRVLVRSLIPFLFLVRYQIARYTPVCLSKYRDYNDSSWCLR